MRQAYDYWQDQPGNHQTEHRGAPEQRHNARVPTLSQGGVVLWFGGPTAAGAEPECRRPRCLESLHRFLSTKTNVSERVPTWRGQAERSRRFGRRASQQTFSSPRGRGSLPSWQPILNTFSHRVSIQASHQLSLAAGAAATASTEVQASLKRARAESAVFHMQQKPAATDRTLLPLTNY